MRHLIFSIYDKKAKAFLKPFTESSVASAERAFHFMVNDSNPNNLVASFPDDYALYYSGHLCNDSGDLVPLDKPVLLTEAATVLKPKVA